MIRNHRFRIIPSSGDDEESESADATESGDSSSDLS